MERRTVKNGFVLLPTEDGEIAIRIPSIIFLRQREDRATVVVAAGEAASWVDITCSLEAVWNLITEPIAEDEDSVTCADTTG